jgi:DeoR/GlpR family transcriptional regulator of sugar metabolism
MPDTLKRYHYVDYREESDEALEKLLIACAGDEIAARRGESAVAKHVRVQPDRLAPKSKEGSKRQTLAATPAVKLVRGSDLSKQLEHRTFFAIQEETHLQVKNLIGQYVAATYLKEGDPILLDAGTSLYAVAKAIAAKTISEPDRCHFTVLTHNLPAFEVLVREARKEAHLNVVLAGGRYDADLNALFGNQTVFAIQDFFPRVVVIGISGLIGNLGVFCHGNTEELDVKRAIFSKHARDRIIVADYTKMGIGDAMRFGEAQAFRTGVERCILVTNAPPKEAPVVVREKFHSEVDVLTRVCGVSVEIVG